LGRFIASPTTTREGNTQQNHYPYKMPLECPWTVFSPYWPDLPFISAIRNEIYIGFWKLKIASVSGLPGPKRTDLLDFVPIYPTRKRFHPIIRHFRVQKQRNKRMEGYYKKSLKENQKGPRLGQAKEVRADSWSTNPKQLRANYQLRRSRRGETITLGFVWLFHSRNYFEPLGGMYQMQPAK
jgi:hypothetical protein